MQEEIIFQLTTVDDLLAIARSLLAYRGLEPVFERIGVHGEMSDDEERAVSEVIENFCVFITANDNIPSFRRSMTTLAENAA